MKPTGFKPDEVRLIETTRKNGTKGTAVQIVYWTGKSEVKETSFDQGMIKRVKKLLDECEGDEHRFNNSLDKLRLPEPDVICKERCDLPGPYFRYQTDDNGSIKTQNGNPLLVLDTNGKPKIYHEMSVTVMYYITAQERNPITGAIDKPASKEYVEGWSKAERMQTQLRRFFTPATTSDADDDNDDDNNDGGLYADATNAPKIGDSTAPKATIVTE